MIKILRGNSRYFDGTIEMYPTDHGFLEHSMNDVFCNSIAAMLDKPSRVWWMPQNDTFPEEAVETVIPSNFNLSGKYIVNIDRQVYVNIDRYCTKYDVTFHPLPLLTAIKYPDGFPDKPFEGKYRKLIGLWAGALIYVSDTKPSGLGELDVYFGRDE